MQIQEKWTKDSLDITLQGNDYLSELLRVRLLQ